MVSIYAIKQKHSKMLHIKYVRVASLLFKDQCMVKRAVSSINNLVKWARLGFGYIL